MQRQTQTQTVEIYEADYVTYARLMAVLWVIIFTPILLLLRWAIAGALPEEAGAAITGWLLGPLGLAVAYLAGFVDALIVVWAFNMAAGWGGVRAGIRTRETVVVGQYELRSIGVGSATLIGGMAGLFLSELMLLAMLTLLIMFAPLPDLRTSAGVGVLAGSFALGGMLGGALNGLLVCVIYNVLARLMGGVRFRMG
jgi:hypothetical protein